MTSRSCGHCGAPIGPRRRFCDQSCWYAYRRHEAPPTTPDPTPKQIRERAAAIRATWTEEERQARMAPADRTREFTIPVYLEF